MSVVEDCSSRTFSLPGRTSMLSSNGPAIALVAHGKLTFEHDFKIHFLFVNLDFDQGSQYQKYCVETLIVKL